MIIKVRVKDTYGTRRIYPKSSIREIEILTGKKTISTLQCEALKRLGHSIETVAEDWRG